MGFHYSDVQADWHAIPLAKRSIWQRVAGQTRGIVTPGNIISMLGIALVLAGLGAMWQGQYMLGFVLLTIGRICDIADGTVAHATRTKSPLGEAVDATCDKISAFATLIVFAAASLLWWPAAVLIGVQNLLNSYIGLIGKQRRYRLHPLPTGKISTAGEWGALLLFGLLAALGQSHTGPYGIAAYSLLGASLLLGVHATAGYIRSFLNQRAAVQSTPKA